MSQVQTNIGMRIKVMPGARRLRMVVMMLIEPMMDEAPRMWIARMVMSTPMPPCVTSGGYSVQPDDAAPPGTKNEPINRMVAGINNQNDQLFRRGNAMSAVPICIGISQLAKPTNAGITAPKIITSACTVVRALKNSGWTICKPGWNNSARINSAIAPPTKNITSENHRYIEPMSLWLVVVNMRVHGPGP